MKNIMKKYGLIVFLLISVTSFSQILEDETTNSRFDISTMNFETVINNEKISGIIYEDNVKGNRFYILENKEKILIIRFRDKHSIENCMGMITGKRIPWDFQINDIYYLNESLKTIKKKIKKNQFEGLKSLNIIFHSSNYGDIWLDEKEIEKKRKEKVEKQERKIRKEKKSIDHKTKTNLQDYIGLYKIQILQTGEYDFSNYKEFGTIYIDTSGILMTTGIPTIKEIIGFHWIDRDTESMENSEGNFICRGPSSIVTNPNFYFFIISIDKKNGTGGYYPGKNSEGNKTTFKIIK